MLSIKVLFRLRAKTSMMLSYLEIYQMLEIWVLDPIIFFFLNRYIF